MGRWFAIRLLWLLVTLFGVTFVTFFVLDRAPVDRAEIVAEQGTVGGSFTDRAARQRSIEQLRIRAGLIDPITHEPLPVWQRYVAWLGKALTLRLALPGDDHDAMWRRLSQALPVTMLLGGLSLLLALAFGLPIGAWLGRSVGTPRERTVSSLLLVAVGIPEFLLATLLLLLLSAAWLQWFPAGGLRSNGADEWLFVWQVLDFAWHLVLPVLVMAIGPFVMVTRFVRDSVARAASLPFATCMRALGIESSIVRRRLWRHGATPIATLAGGLLPMLVGGSIVVENLFSLDGLGHLAFQAVLGQDQATVMALVLLTSFVTLIALLVSDVLHRLVDPRVRLSD